MTCNVQLSKQNAEQTPVSSIVIFIVENKWSIVACTLTNRTDYVTVHTILYLIAIIVPCYHNNWLPQKSIHSISDIDRTVENTSCI